MAMVRHVQLVQALRERPVKRENVKRDLIASPVLTFHVFTFHSHFNQDPPKLSRAPPLAAEPARVDRAEGLAYDPRT